MLFSSGEILGWAIINYYKQRDVNADILTVQSSTDDAINCVENKLLNGPFYEVLKDDNKGIVYEYC